MRIHSCKTAVAAAPLIVAILFGSGRAYASVSHTYHGINCIGVTDLDNDIVSIQGTTMIASNWANVVCPVPKTTSGPQITNDNISSITMTVAGSLQCTLSVSMNLIFDSTSSNNIYLDTQVANGTTVSFADPGIQDYWTYTQNYKQWLYAEMFCVMPPQSQISSYVVVEAGTSQATTNGKGYAILPPSYCHLDAMNTNGWAFHGGAGCGFPGPQPCDFVEAANYTNTNFIWDCPRYASQGTYIQMTVGPTVNGNQMGCNHRGDYNFDRTWEFVTGSEFPDRELNPVQNTSELLCHMNGGNGLGDGKIVSYRTAAHASDLPFMPGN